MVVICGGSLTMSRNELENWLRCPSHFVGKNSNTNIITIDAPLRFDLVSFHVSMLKPGSLIRD